MVNKSGKLGEDYACNKLEKSGYKVVARNFHSRYGEIDIIAEQNGYLAFVEVKTRSNTSYGTPAQFVDFRKQQKIIKTAYCYLEKYPSQLQPRFDVVEIIIKNKYNFDVEIFNHFKNAFGI